MDDASRAATSRRSVVALTILLGACAPVVTRLYVPQVPAASLVRSSCAFNTHVPVAATVPLGGASAVVSLAGHAGRDHVELRLDVPAGTEIRFEDDAVLVTAGASGEPRRFRFPSVSLVDTPIVNSFSTLPALQAQQQPVLDPLVGATVQAGSTLSARHFWLATYVETGGAPSAVVTLPRVKVNGIPQDGIRIEFKRQWIASVALLNC